MLRIRIYTSLSALEQLRRLWEFVRKQRPGTIFQGFDWNLLAARVFGQREEPRVVVAEASYGIAIVPAAVRLYDRRVRLLGEELFDYRSVLYAGDEEIARPALAALAQFGGALEMVAVRQCDRNKALERLELEPFALAPAVCRTDITAEDFAASHGRLARNLRRFQRQGFRVKLHSGENSVLVRAIYEAKARHDPRCLFRDSLRVDFMVQAALLHSSRFEIFTLESSTGLAAALVTLREDAVRRFYTCLFDARFARLSPAMVLIHEVTRRSLESGLDCDYMTGEQEYKMRLATASMPLYRARASTQHLAKLAAEDAALRRAG